MRDAELLDLARAGKPEAFERLVEPYVPMLLAYSRAVSGDYHLAMDVVQQTLLVAYRKLHHFFPEADFGVWLRAIARRTVGPRPVAHVVGDLVVEPARREVTVGDSPVELTAREFSLLEALARRSPDVVAKADLLDAVWGADRDVDPNAVEVYIGYLRRKIGAARIQTVRGAGYRLVAPS